MAAILFVLLGWATSYAAEPSLVGHWPLKGDARDRSGNENHGVNHGVDLESGGFDGESAFVEVLNSPSLRLGREDFSIAAWVYTDQDVADAFGDVVGKFDPATRKGLNLSIGASAAGYNSSGNDAHVYFGLDDASEGQWRDCGRPGGLSHTSDALTVFEGQLYAGVTDAPGQDDWAHVFRYRGENEWEDCGRLGSAKTRGVYAMVVHDGALYAATSSSHGAQPNTVDFGSVYQYRPGQEWEDLGQPGANYRLNSLASYRGKLYACGFNIGSVPGYCYVYEGDKTWRACGEFDGWPHAMAVHHGRLHAAYPKGEVFSYDGEAWQSLGNPFDSFMACSQIHSLGVFRGELVAGTWPLGRVAVRRNDAWIDLGRPSDATEVIGLTVYNGSLYAGTIPRAEVLRYDGEQTWTSIRRLFDPPGFEPVPVGSGDKAVADWSRATSLTVSAGKLFVSTGTCYRTQIESPPPDDIRGKVFSWETGANVSYDRDMGHGWKHLAAIRDGNGVTLYIDGEKAATAQLDTERLDVSNDEPLRIGFGQLDYFSGRIRDVRIYAGALKADAIRSIVAEKGYE